jgi:hypothetical protein
VTLKPGNHVGDGQQPGYGHPGAPPDAPILTFQEEAAAGKRGVLSRLVILLLVAVPTVAVVVALITGAGIVRGGIGLGILVITLGGAALLRRRLARGAPDGELAGAGALFDADESESPWYVRHRGAIAATIAVAGSLAAAATVMSGFLT